MNFRIQLFVGLDLRGVKMVEEGVVPGNGAAGVLAPRKGRGRPRLETATVVVSVRLPAKTLARLERRARRRERGYAHLDCLSHDVVFHAHARDGGSWCHGPYVGAGGYAIARS